MITKAKRATKSAAKPIGTRSRGLRLSPISARPFHLKRILVTTDFSDESKKALPFAAALAKRLGSEVALLHVLEPRSRFVGWELVDLLHAGDATVGRVYSGLDSLVKETFGSGTVVETHVRTGQPYQEIPKAAGDLDVDLLVIATHGYTGLKHTLLGSTTERVIRHSRCPVLAVRGRPERRSGKPGGSALIQRIVLGTDFSDNSLKAFPVAQALAASFGARITLMHIVERFPIDAMLGQETTRKTSTRLMEAARERLTELSMSLRKESGHKVDIAVRFGTPYAELVAAAKGLKDSLIVLATHGYTGLKHMYLGSVAERVVRHADCPVLVVR